MLHTPGLEKHRHARVWLPRGYGTHEKHPLVLLFDGQNVFHDHGSFSGGWHAHATADRLAAVTRAAPIIVGLDHGNEHRIVELSPFASRFGEGRFETLLGWVADHLVPILRTKYRVSSEPRDVLVGGSSMGGLAAFYAHLRRPDVFGGAIAMSPSLWLGGGALYDFVRAQSKPWATRIYLDAGAREGRMADATRSMADELSARGWSRDELLHVHDPRGGHNERSWKRRLPRALRFTLGRGR